MANPILPTNGTHELQERYANTIKALFRKENNLRQFAGRDYEGDPKAGAVKIPVRDTEVSVGNYDVVAGGTLGTSSTSYLNVLVDGNVFINELIDGYEAAAVPDNVVAQRLGSAAFSLQRRLELDFINEIRENGTDSPEGTAATAEADMYKAITRDIGVLIDLGVDVSDIKVAISTQTEDKLLTDEKYTNTASNVGSERAMLGIVNMIRGAEVIRSSNLGSRTAGTAGTVEYIVFSPLWAQALDEWMVMPNINDLKDGLHIGASALQGREVFAQKLTDTKGAIVKVAV